MYEHIITSATSFASVYAIIFSAVGILGLLPFPVMVLLFFAGNAGKGTKKAMVLMFTNAIFFLIPALCYFSMTYYSGLEKWMCAFVGFLSFFVAKAIGGFIMGITDKDEPTTQTEQ